jgi:hypothetical protein
MDLDIKEPENNQFNIKEIYCILEGIILQWLSFNPWKKIIKYSQTQPKL